MDEIEILKARLEFQAARINELERQNQTYLENLKYYEDTIKQMNEKLEGVFKNDKTRNIQ